MDRMLTMVCAGVLVAGSMTLNMVRYPAVWDMVGGAQQNRSAAAAAPVNTAWEPPPAREPVGLGQATAPATSDVRERAVNLSPDPVAVRSAVEPRFDVSPLPSTAATQLSGFRGVEQPAVAQQPVSLAPPAANVAPLGRLDLAPASPPAAMPTAANRTNKPVETGTRWAAESGAATLSMTSPALRPLGDAVGEPRRLQPIAPVDETPASNPGEPSNDLVRRLPPVGVPTVTPLPDVNAPLPDGTRPVYPRTAAN